ncbi:hypothetical protein DFH11DRAFT_44281 [Phellopilus nigrolimitatus]|nr:hypothetical protein DFH11DRAFT_44281 [Phellopilus nigrolimitatus]
MSSPISDVSDSRDSQDDPREQSTKDRRRERNRLAAQKHRLRRNERMSHLEQQVLALQQEKNNLLSQLDSLGQPAQPPAAAPPPPPSSSSSSSIPIDPELQSDLPHRAKRPRTATSADRDHHLLPRGPGPGSPHHHPLLYDDTVRRMQDRIVELERWSEDLNGDLADALDSESRLKHELHHTAHNADAHARRLADALHAADVERARNLREIADLRDALDADAASARTLRDTNHRLRESVEAAEVTLDLQRVDNERLRARLAEEDSKAAARAARLELELADARHELEDAHAESRRLRKLLREQESIEAAAVEARQQRKERDEDERRRSEEREAAGNDTIAALTSRLSQTEALVAAKSRQLEDAQAEAKASERECRKLSERVSSLQGSLEKVGTFLASKGIPIDLDD